MWAVKADFLHPPSGPEMFNPDTAVTFHRPLFVGLFLISVYLFLLSSPKYFKMFFLLLESNIRERE